MIGRRHDRADHRQRQGPAAGATSRCASFWPKAASSRARAGSPLPSTPRWCRAARGTTPASGRTTGSRSCRSCAEAEDMDAKPAASGLAIAGKSFGSRLMIGSSRYPNQQVMLDAIEASGAEIVTVAVRRVSRGRRRRGAVRRAGRAIPPAAQHRRLLHRARRGADRPARARGAGHQLDQARGHRRRRDLVPRRGRAAARGRGSGARRVHRAALLQRRPDHLPQAGGSRLRRGHAARRADRLGHGNPQPLQPAHHPRGGQRAGDRRCRRRHRVGRGDRARAGLRRNPARTPPSPARATR